MNGGVVALDYDGDGNRVAKTVNNVTTTYLVDDLNPTGYPQVMDEIVGGAVEREYTYGLQRISENQILSGGWTPSFYGYDGAESVRYLANATGTVTDTYEYDAFGNEIYKSGSTPNNYLYRGEQWDPDLSLYYLRARYMNPITGRFLSRDPENGDPSSPASLHKYLYAGADPVNLVDPSGRGSIAEDIQLTFAIALGSVTSMVVLADRINCSYTQEGTYTPAMLYGGIYTQPVAIGPCTFQGYSRQSPPTIYPLPWPFPISTPAPREPYRKHGGCDPSGSDPDEWHHIVPQAERAWAEGCGFDIDQPGLGMCLKGSCHARIHGGSNGTDWNAEWAYQIDNVWGRQSQRCPSDQELVSFAQSLVVQFAEDILCQ